MIRDNIDNYFKDKRNKSQSELQYNPDNIEKIGNQEVILLLDDEKSIVNLLEIVFKSYNFNIVTFINPFEALNYFKLYHNHIDIIITDFSIPGIEGIKLIKKFKDIDKNVPLVLFTGHSYITFENEDDKKLIDAHIYKPMLPKDIVNKIKSIIDKGKPHE